MISYLKGFGLGFLVMLMIVIANQGDYQEAVRQAQEYCQMVKMGAWPAYRNDINCEDLK